jgi:hypothetical protein
LGVTQGILSTKIPQALLLSFEVVENPQEGNEGEEGTEEEEPVSEPEGPVCSLCSVFHDRLDTNLAQTRGTIGRGVIVEAVRAGSKAIHITEAGRIIQ